MTLNESAESVWRVLGAPGGMAAAFGERPWQPIADALEAVREACAQIADPADLDPIEEQATRRAVAATIRALR